ncbi:unnamed protein product, partial [Candidula unifasciata]
MAGRQRGASTKLYNSLFIVVCLLWCAASQAHSEVDLPPLDKHLEDSIATDMLNIVDKKFETLTTRIASLESAVNSLQYYSIRHIREMRGRLQSTDNDLETVRKQVTQLGDEQRSHNAVVSVMATDVSELKKSSADLLGEFESSVFYINENLDKQNKDLKTLLEDTVIRSSREVTEQISKQLEETVQQMEQLQVRIIPCLNPEPASCSVDFSGISEHIDLRFAEFKMQTHAYFVRLINAAQLDIISGKRFSDDESKVEETKKEKDKPCDCKADSTKNNSFRADRADDTVGHAAYTLVSRNENISSAENVTAQTAHDVHRKYQDENDEQVMNALYNMTTSVLQAVNYFRNTGRMLEQILSNTDSIIIQQTDITKRFNPLYLGVLSSTEDDESYQSNIIPGAQGAEKRIPLKRLSPVKTADAGCSSYNEVFKNVTAIIRNGSQLLEVLTDLAQLSSVSLSKVTAALQDEVTRVEGIRTQMATTMLARTSGDKSDPVIVLTNVTQKTLKLVEAVASNTGWLPQIHHNVQLLESMTNRSLYGVLQNHALLRRIQEISPNQEDPVASFGRDNNKTTGHGTSRTHSNRHRSSNSDLNESTKDEAALNRESLETIYSTSLQLNRIMPALTKLLSEPDPLITLVGGGRPDQGRVEIYHNGLWGALCQRDLSHAEADLICRHLGFRGGISAGSGHFGSGTGASWIFNASCLASPQCPVVSYSDDTAQCSHELDAGVICDHMLRIVSTDGSTKGKVGRLEIHHR